MLYIFVFHYYTNLQDDDSDLEYEVEAIPSVSSDASTEAAACVKACWLNFVLND